MNKRIAILPFPGDPFLLNYWLGLYDRIWSDEVDGLFIYINSPVEEAAIEYIKDRISKSRNVSYEYVNSQIEHGLAIDRSLDLVDSKNIMLIEDDAFIFKKGVVDACFSKLENGEYDIVGSKRASCAFEILDRAKLIWNISYDGEGDHGPNFWPNFFFSSKELLISTDRNFCSKAWYKDDIIEALGNYRVKDEVANGDTFVNTSLQLRAKVPQDKILCLPQYHGHPDDEEHARQGKYLFDGSAPWCHIGSLSSGIGGLLMDREGRTLAKRKIDEPKEETILPNYRNSDFERREFERRVQWWLNCWQHAVVPANTELYEFYVLYKEAIDRIIAQYGLSRKVINRRISLYHEHFNL